ncbi:hypothetical protein [Microcoleus asticus]|uniref:hypothetical protein n=1 Tax=Microcoleus asticus TaxID=2815231 RepID=UPI0015561E1E|nr:hypothetical protein [Microcoleus asticus]
MLASEFYAHISQRPWVLHRHKRPNPAELFPSPKSDSSAIDLTSTEALTALSVLAVVADHQISKKRQTLVANTLGWLRTKHNFYFRRAIGHNVNG